MNEMRSSTIVAPSLLAANFLSLKDEIAAVTSAGADWLHLDIMDGSFVPPISFGQEIVRAVSSMTKLPLDVHLMIRDPDRQLQSFKDAGASRITVHQETCPHLHRSLGAIRGLGISPGVALNPGTPVESLYEVLDMCDLVLVMTVNPGWGGQPFLESTLGKIEKLRQECQRRKLSTHIEVDGGINAETAERCRRAGANVMVAGSFVFGSKDRKAAVAALR